MSQAESGCKIHKRKADDPLQPERPHVVTRDHLKSMVASMDTSQVADEQALELLERVADDFVDNVVRQACALAKHRASSKLEIADIKLALERHWDMSVPGFTTEATTRPPKPFATDAHKQRISLVKRTQQAQSLQRLKDSKT